MLGVFFQMVIYRTVFKRMPIFRYPYLKWYGVYKRMQCKAREGMQLTAEEIGWKRQS